MSSLRRRKLWTANEDRMLRAAIYCEDPTSTNKRWTAIARHIPGRNNKDCRKRWHNQMSSLVSKGAWAPEENERLLKAVKEHGTKWAKVAAIVKTRNSTQCAKRWNDQLNPKIKRTLWTPEEDSQLLDAVTQHGHSWTSIVRTQFPGRTGLDAKNRYSCLTRLPSDRDRDDCAPENLPPSEALTPSREFVASEKTRILVSSEPSALGTLSYSNQPEQPDTTSPSTRTINLLPTPHLTPSSESPAPNSDYIPTTTNTLASTPTISPPPTNFIRVPFPSYPGVHVFVATSTGVQLDLNSLTNLLSSPRDKTTHVNKVQHVSTSGPSQTRPTGSLLSVHPVLPEVNSKPGDVVMGDGLSTGRISVAVAVAFCNRSTSCDAARCLAPQTLQQVAPSS